MPISKRHYRISEADAVAAHHQALEIKPGRPGLSNIDNLLSALGRPYHGYHRPLYRKAAALLDAVSTGHGFVDGNKRTAWLLVELLIERSGYELDMPDDEPIDELVVDVVEHRMTVDQLAEWFRLRLRRVG